MIRSDGRTPDELRPVSIKRNYLKFAEGSVLIKTGDTVVICTATVENKVPPFLAGAGKGWVTAEYAMLPRSSQKRIPRESVSGKIGGRTHEIQRLIGRSLRAVVNLSKLGERTIFVDCDCIQADGGTRTASITGAFVALADTINSLLNDGEIEENPLMDTVAATSAGIVNGTPVLDLNYREDSSAEVDMNVVMTGTGKIIEIQGTAEGSPFSREELDSLIILASNGIEKLTTIQLEAIGKRQQ